MRHLPLALTVDKPPHYGLRYVFPAKAGIHLLCATCHRPWWGTSPRATVSGTSFPQKRESIFSVPLATGPDGGQAPALRSQVRLSRKSGNPSSLCHLPPALAGDKPPRYRLTVSCDSTSPIRTSTGSARTASQAQYERKKNAPRTVRRLPHAPQPTTNRMMGLTRTSEYGVKPTSRRERPELQNGIHALNRVSVRRPIRREAPAR